MNKSWSFYLLFLMCIWLHTLTWKQKKGLFSGCYFFKRYLCLFVSTYVHWHHLWFLLSSSDAWYYCIPEWIWIRKQFECMPFCQNQTWFIMLFWTVHNFWHRQKILKVLFKVCDTAYNKRKVHYNYYILNIFLLSGSSNELLVDEPPG